MSIPRSTLRLGHRQSRALAWTAWAAAVLGLALNGCSGSEERPATELVLSGIVETRGIRAASRVGGRVVAVHVGEGDRVAAGDLLVSLDPEALDLQIEEQSFRVAEARARLRLLREGSRQEELARARVAWETAEATRVRQEQLVTEGIVSREAYEEVEARASESLEYLREAEAGQRLESLRLAEAGVGREGKRLEYLRHLRGETAVRAPVGGLVETLVARAGDVIEANRTVAEIQTPEELWLYAYVPEPSLGRVRVGQAAAISVDAFPERSFEGRVVTIANRAEYTPRNIQTRDQRSDQVFRVKVAVDGRQELKPGMAATVRLEGSARPPAAGS